MKVMCGSLNLTDPHQFYVLFNLKHQVAWQQPFRVQRIDANNSFKFVNAGDKTLTVDEDAKEGTNFAWSTTTEGKAFKIRVNPCLIRAFLRDFRSTLTCVPRQLTPRCRSRTRTPIATFKLSTLMQRR